MAQYFDFGDQVGPLLQQAISHLEQKREFDSQQALAYLKLSDERRFQEQQVNLRKSEIEKEDQYRQGVLAESKSRDISEASNKLRDDFIPLGQVQAAFGNDWNKVKNLISPTDATVINKQLDVFGSEGSKGGLIPGQYVDAKIADMLQKRLMAEKAMAALNKSMPTNLLGSDMVPTPKLKEESVARSEVEIPIPDKAKNPLEVNDSRTPGANLISQIANKAYSFLTGTTSKEGAERYIAERLPALVGDGSQISNVQVDSQKGVIRFTKNKIDPAQVYFERSDVQNFMEKSYPTLLQSYVRMTPQSRKANEDELIALGGRLGTIAQQYPEYASKLAPFYGYAQKYSEDQAFKMQKQTAYMDALKQMRMNSLVTGIAGNRNIDQDTREQAQTVLMQILTQGQQPQ